MDENKYVLIEENELKDIADFLLAKYRLDFSNYTKTSFGRRIARFYNIHSLNNITDLANFLERETDALTLFINEVTVNTTEMFRDPEFWKYLRFELLPTFSDLNTIRIWHAGCSSGEEVVSMIILLTELNLIHKTKLVGTDINSDVLSKTERFEFRRKELDLYQKNYLESGGRETLEKYFILQEDLLILKQEYKPSNILFKLHNLAVDEPFSKFDLILCRNVMIYFDEILQSKAVKKFKQSLFKKSYLAVGRKENISFLPESNELNCINSKEKIYQTIK